MWFVDLIVWLGWAVCLLLAALVGMLFGMSRQASIDKKKAASSTAGVASGELTKQIAAAEAETRKAYAARDEYAALIERVIRQRDNRWDMFLAHSREHSAGQAALERALAKTRKMLAEAVRIINSYREKNEEPKLEAPELEGPEDPPFGQAQRFNQIIREMTELIEKQDPPIDAMAMKAEVDRRTQQRAS